MNRIVNNARIFFILSVMYAHLILPINLDENIYNLFSEIFRLFGTIGVPGFIFIGGYLFNTNVSLKELIISKFNRLIIPLLICGSFTFIIMIQSANLDPSIKLYLDWITGRGSIYYFVINLLLYYIIFKIFSRKHFLYFTISLTVFTAYIYDSNIFNLVEYINHYFTVYTNPAVGIGWFSLGIICKNYNILSKKNFICNKNLLSFILLFIIYIIITLYYNIYIGGYNSLSGLLFQFISINLIFQLSNLVKLDKLSIKLYNYSFTIYLLHIQLLQYTTKFHGKNVFLFVHPVIILIVMVSIFDLLVYFQNKYIKKNILKYIGIVKINLNKNKIY